MSLPQLLTDEEVLEALRSGRPLIDVRAPVEFHQGSLPGARNLPLLDDDQRKAVGTTYKEMGQERAVELGRRLISGAVEAERVRAWTEFAKTHPGAVIFCFRGGLRSQLVQKKMAENGFILPIIRGGFKRARALLSKTLTASVTEAPVAVLSGLTGSGKTDILRHLCEEGHLQFLDLEGHARHRGSSFGLMNESQPSPVDFENSVALEWIRLRRSETTWLEDESRTIGRLAIPASLFRRISEAPVDVIERSRADRAVRLTREYLNTFGLIEGESNSDWPKAKTKILEALDRIQQRLGGLRHREIRSEMLLASSKFEASWSFREHWPWVEALLEHYYDPVYLRHLDRIGPRVRFHGSTEDWIRRQRSRA